MWKHDYLERACALVSSKSYYGEAWNKLEDDILGKLSIEQARELWLFCEEIPWEAATIIMSMLPPDLPGFDC